MTKDETKQAIEVMQAYVDGRKIEYRHKASDEWITVAILTSWDWKNWDYRAKPEPMEIDVYFTPEGKPIVEGIVSRDPRHTWTKKKFREVIEE